MLFDAWKETALENYQRQQLDDAVAILLPFIEGCCITPSSLKVSKNKVAEQLALGLYKILSEPAA